MIVSDQESCEEHQMVKETIIVAASHDRAPTKYEALYLHLRE